MPTYDNNLKCVAKNKQTFWMKMSEISLFHIFQFLCAQSHGWLSWINIDLGLCNHKDITQGQLEKVLI